MSSLTPETVSLPTLRALLRLVSDLRDLPSGSIEQRRLALEGLSRLLGAKVALWVDIPRFEGDTAVLECPIDMGWSSEREREVFQRYFQNQNELPDPTLASMASVFTLPRATVRRQDLIRDEDWYASAHVQELRRGADVDPWMVSLRRVAGCRFSAISLHRPWRDRPFSTKERAILDAFSRETPWLDARPPLADAGFSPRLLAVLRGLARGLSEKEVAAELGLSPHTVHDYVKSLHRKLGVRSRAELLARVLGPPHPRR